MGGAVALAGEPRQWLTLGRPIITDRLICVRASASGLLSGLGRAVLPELGRRHLHGRFACQPPPTTTTTAAAAAAVVEDLFRLRNVRAGPVRNKGRRLGGAVLASRAGRTRQTERSELTNGRVYLKKSITEMGPKLVKLVPLIGALVVLVVVGHGLGGGLAEAAENDASFTICSEQFKKRPTAAQITDLYQTMLRTFIEHPEIHQLVGESYHDFKDSMKDATGKASQKELLDKHNIRVCQMYSMIRNLVNNLKS